jgi:hypothetical protein
MRTKTSKRFWVGFVVIGALQSSGTAFADDCDPKFFICPPPHCWGDPHCRTEDGVLYDCQGAGEFTLIVAGAHTIMATYEPAAGSTFVGSSSLPVTHTVNKK